jgi:hypothetical protein
LVSVVSVSKNAELHVGAGQVGEPDSY